MLRFISLGVCFLSFVFVACAQAPQPTVALDNLNHFKIKPGQVLKLTMKHEGNFVPDKAFCGADSILFEKMEDHSFFFFAPSYFSNLGVKITCGFKGKGKAGEELEKTLIQLVIIDGEFHEEKLTVSSAKVHFTKKALKQIARDRKILDKLYHHPLPRAQFSNPFLSPMDSVITSQYGGRRIFNDKKRSQHLGTDYRATVGTEVKATNDGVVGLSEDLFFTGETVIIDHGLGIFSMYGHLSKLLVKKGDKVKAGQVIALSGATGRVSGPHLHWGIKMNYNWINPLSLVEATNQ